MTFLVVGLNHRNAALDIRSRFAFNLEQLASPLSGLRERLSRMHGHPEVVLLSTCNRFELYCAGEVGVKDAAIPWLAGLAGMTCAELLRHVYVLEDRDVARHVFRVASGLDSMVIGETQILGQIKQAVRKANELGCVGSLLNQLFQQAFTVAKQVRSGTGIGEQSVSVAAVAARLVSDLSLSGRSARTLLVGAGETIELVAVHLSARAPGTIAAIANRTIERARTLTSRFSAEAMPLTDIAARLHEFDAVVACTGSAQPLIETEVVRHALMLRGQRPMQLIDLAVPKNIEPEVANLQGATLCNMDDIARLVQAGNDKRRQAADSAETIVLAAVTAFDAWLEQRGAVPLIRALQTQVDDWRATEIANARKRLARGQDIESVLDALTQGLTRKIMHGTLSELRAADRDQRQHLAQTVSQLFLRCPVRRAQAPVTPVTSEISSKATVLDFSVRPIVENRIPRQRVSRGRTHAGVRA